MVTQDKVFRILIVDDNLDFSSLVRRVLKQMGFESDCVESGAECIETLGRVRYALIFLDINLPDRPGIEVAREIGAVLGAEARPVIIGFSGHPIDYLESDEIAAIDFFLQKPMELQKTKDLLAASINRAKTLRPD